MNNTTAATSSTRKTTQACRRTHSNRSVLRCGKKNTNTRVMASSTEQQTTNNISTACPYEVSLAQMGFKKEMRTLPTVHDAVREGEPKQKAETTFKASVGWAQARYFEKLCTSSKVIHIVSSEKYDVPDSMCGCDDGDSSTRSQSIQFRLGGPRLDTTADVNRVTGNVIEMLNDPRVRVSVSASGTVVGEICFPLDNVNAWSGTSGNAMDAMVQSIQALFMNLEKPAIVETVQCLMEKGSDDRSVFKGEERVNKYHTGMIPKPASTIHRGSCTSSSPTPSAQEAAVAMAQRMWSAPGYSSDTQLMHEVCERVVSLLAPDVDGAMMVAHPSGTDAENFPLIHAIMKSRELAIKHNHERTAVQRGEDRPQGELTDNPRGSVTSIVVAAGEVGSGTAQACEGRYFSSRIPIGGSQVEMSSELPTLHTLARLDVHEMVCRCEKVGMLRNNYDAMVAEAARAALHSDPAKVVVLHMVAGSKTGMTVPSESCVDELVAEFGKDRVICVLDCCQMRHEAALIPRWLNEHGFALVTASKFYAGPSFAGGVLMSGKRVDEMNAMIEREQAAVQAAYANASASYLTPHDVGAVIPQLTKMLPAGPCNYGMLLRWASGLHEMERMADSIQHAGGAAAAGEAMCSWVNAVRTMVDASHGDELVRLPVEDYEGLDYQVGGINSIVALRLRSDANSRFLNADELKQVYGFMYSDASDLLEEGTLTKEEKDVMSCKILLGQPVAMPDGSAVLRTCMGAPQFSNLLSGEEPLDVMLKSDATVLAKLALCARHYEALTLASASTAAA
mmetsp:Transcript_13278/g.30385  ORF Transcript_13278/g.30385 Transcript_13278/m.30385 type:complete len:790 (-) Transcript_13278:104-2473(-)|eukprot:CAMPEP_0198709392 /NCGR_PEP_ID=MMETSP1471-20131121/1688_1 /TAXON_ID=41880 /ORGANISM="Pycnococcus provasolii, Strain RCC733" /LENGTH=789 /DNA_ID=CAMNT_0044468735 /DNA_START=147 /DNA_END=2516 /DNA_ORIENTATION=+